MDTDKILEAYILGMILYSINPAIIVYLFSVLFKIKGLSRKLEDRAFYGLEWAYSMITSLLILSCIAIKNGI